MEVHALVLEADGHPAHCPDEVVLHAGDLGDVEATRRLVLEIAPREVYNLAAISSVAQSWDEPDLHRARQRPGRGRPDGVGAPGRRRRPPRAGVQRGDLRRAATTRRRTRPPRSRRSTRTARRRPSPTSSARVFRQRDLHVSSAILYNHESPRRHPRFVTRKITSTVAAIARGEADELVARQPRRPPRLGLGPRLRRRDGPRRPRGRRRATTSSRPGSPTPCGTSWPPPSRPPASTTGSTLRAAGRGVLPAGRPDRAGRRREPRARASSAGRPRSTSPRS